VLRTDPHLIAFDPDRARRALLADGWIPGPDGIRVKHGQRLSLRLPYQAGAPDLDETIELLRVELRSVGIEIVTRTYSHTILFAPASDGGIIAGAKFDIVLYSSTLTTVPDLASNFDCAQVPPHGETYTRWCDPRLAAPLVAMRQAYDTPAMERAYAQINRRFGDEAESIQLFVWRGGYAMRDRVHGYAPNLVSSFDQIYDVSD